MKTLILLSLGLALISLVSCATYSGPGLAAVMNSYCRGQQTFAQFDNCIKTYWHYPSSAEGLRDELVPIFESRMDLLRIYVSQGDMSDAVAIADSRSLAAQLRARNAAAARQANYRLMQVLSSAAAATNTTGRPSNSGNMFQTCNYNVLGEIVPYPVSSASICPPTRNFGGVTGILQ